jgi:hypothetical protein
MAITKKYIKGFLEKLIPIPALIGSIVVAVIFGGKTVIDYYCAIENSFFGFHLKGYSLCPYYVHYLGIDFG